MQLNGRLFKHEKAQATANAALGYLSAEMGKC
jgi:hypothetical protein